MKSEKLKFPVRPFRTKGGVKAPHRKNTAEMESVVMPCPAQVILPMQQHIGAPCTPTVKVGDEVKVGQVIGDSDAFVSAPIHASVSGKIKKIDTILMPAGNYVQAVVIESDGEMTLSPDLQPPKVETPGDLQKVIRQSGLVGLGGAGFPAHVKLNMPSDNNVDTLIINAAECEPYITADHREALENSWQVLSGIYAVKDILNIDRVIIAIEDNKPDAIKVLSEIADNSEYDPENTVRVLPLKARYPQGAEKVLIRACTGRKVPAGKLPSDVGCIVMNIASVSFLAQYLKTGIPLVTKRITVDGSAVNNPQNVIVPIGTPVSEVIKFCGGYKGEVKKLLMGGPMMGIALSDDTLPIIKQNNAILAFGESDAKLMEESDCIRCGKCVKSCPMNLVPPAISASIKLKETDNLEKLGIMTCMECGCCAYSCPAGKHIVQNMRRGKAMVREAQAKKRKDGGK